MPCAECDPWQRAQAAWGPVFNLAISAIGAGILGFPFAFAQTGLVGGFFVCALVSCLALCTLNILARQAVIHNACNYQHLVKEGLGVKWRIDWGVVTSLAIVLLGYGACVAYLTILGENFRGISDNLVHYVNHKYPCILPHIPAVRQVPIIVLGTLVVLPLSFRRRMEELQLIVFIGAKALIALKAGDIDFELVHKVVFNKHSLQAIPIMVFAYSCHVPCVELFYELHNSASLFACFRARPQNLQCCQRAHRNIQEEGTSTDLDIQLGMRPSMRRKLPCMTIIHLTTIAACTVLYLIAGVGGYLLFPTIKSQDVLAVLEEKHSVPEFLCEIVAFAVLLHYPINSHTARSAAYDILCWSLDWLCWFKGCPYRVRDSSSIDSAPAWESHALTLAVFAASMTTACITNDLGTVFALLGGVCSCTVVVIMPGLLVLEYAQRMKNRNQRRIAEPLLFPHPVEALNMSFLDSAAIGWIVSASGALILVITLYVIAFTEGDKKNGVFF